MAPPPPPSTVNILEISQIAPLPNSVSPISLPLTFFDAFWLHSHPTQRLFFYDLPHPKSHFIDTLLPKLKHALSLTLQIFYPFAGNLTLSQETGKYEIRYIDGDSVELKVAESYADFKQLAQNNPRDVRISHPLVPELPVSNLSATPVLALQVTVFPDSGVCIGITAHHAAADGRSFIHFMKSWATVTRSGDASSVAPLPVYDRTMIKHHDGREMIFSTDSEKSKADSGSLDDELKSQTDPVRATFVLKRADIERLRRLVSARYGETFRYSTFVLTCAYVWVCSAKARHDVGEEEEYFGFAADCRARLDPPVPETYFGNCVGGSMTKIKGSDLLGEDGIAVASDAIRKAIQGLGNGVPWEDKSWNSDSFTAPPMHRLVSVAGSPIFRVYDTDFGWGRPRKVEVISIESSNAISLAENRDKEGGIEIGLVRPKHIMDGLVSLFEEGLKLGWPAMDGGAANGEAILR